jgi:ankyrin repeat protein
MEPDNRKTRPRHSSILKAVLASDEKALQAAIDRGGDLNAWDDLGMTPLLYAVFRGDIRVVDLLLRSGADPNRPKRDDPSSTPLWHATKDFGLYEIACLLEEAGAKSQGSA